MHKDQHKSRMKPHADAPPGLETDGHANIIPPEQRTPDDREKTLAGLRDAMHGKKTTPAIARDVDAKPPAADH